MDPSSLEIGVNDSLTLNMPTTPLQTLATRVPLQLESLAPPIMIMISRATGFQKDDSGGKSADTWNKVQRCRRLL